MEAPFIPWSDARLNFNKGIINFTTCGMAVIGGVQVYAEGKLSSEPKEKCVKDAPEAYRILNMLLFAHAVDLFQSYLSDLIFEVISIDSRPIRGKKFDIGLMLDAPDLNTAKRVVIDRYVLDLGYQSVEALSETLEKSFGISGLKHWLTKLRLTRYVQTRNIITHNRGIVNSVYMYRSRSKIDVAGNYVKHQKPLKVVKYLSSLAGLIDEEAVRKFCIKGGVL